MRQNNTGKGILVNVDHSLIEFAHSTPIKPEEISCANEATAQHKTKKSWITMLTIPLLLFVAGAFWTTY